MFNCFLHLLLINRVHLNILLLLPLNLLLSFIFMLSLWYLWFLFKGAFIIRLLFPLLFLFRSQSQSLLLICPIPTKSIVLPLILSTRSIRLRFTLTLVYFHPLHFSWCNPLSSALLFTHIIELFRLLCVIIPPSLILRL